MLQKIQMSHLSVCLSVSLGEVRLLRSGLSVPKLTQLQVCVLDFRVLVWGSEVLITQLFSLVLIWSWLQSWN